MTLIYGYILLLRIALQVIRLQGKGAAQAGHFLFKVIILKLLIGLSPRRNSAIQTTEPNSHIQYLAMRSRGCGSKYFPYKILRCYGSTLLQFKQRCYFISSGRENLTERNVS